MFESIGTGYTPTEIAEIVVKAVEAVLILLFVGCLIGFLMGYPIMLMVNYLFTPQSIYKVFGGYSLTFWKAFWLGCLCRVLFKGTSTSKNQKETCKSKQT